MNVYNSIYFFLQSITLKKQQATLATRIGPKKSRAIWSCRLTTWRNRMEMKIAKKSTAAGRKRKFACRFVALIITCDPKPIYRNDAGFCLISPTKFTRGGLTSVRVESEQGKQYRAPVSDELYFK